MRVWSALHRQAEVHQLHHAVFLDEHVGGLDVAVANALAVQVLQRGCGLGRDLQRLVEGQGATAEAVLEALALDELHLEVGGVEVGAYVPHLHDVRMVELEQDLGFTNEARFGLWNLANRAVQHLDRGQDPVRRPVVAAVDRAHPATPQGSLDDPDVDLIAWLQHRPSAVNCSRLSPEVPVESTSRKTSVPADLRVVCKRAGERGARVTQTWRASGMVGVFTLTLAFSSPVLASGDFHGPVPPPTDGDVLDPVLSWGILRQQGGTLSAGGMFEYVNRPLVRKILRGGQETEEVLLGGAAAIDISASYAVHDRVAIGLSAPLFVATSGVDGTSGPTLGDAHLWVPVGIVLPNADGSGFGLSLVPFLDAPTGSSARFVGDTGVGAGALLVSGINTGPITLSGNLGIEGPSRSRVRERARRSCGSLRLGRWLRRQRLLRGTSRGGGLLDAQRRRRGGHPGRAAWHGARASRRQRVVGRWRRPRHHLWDRHLAVPHVRGGGLFAGAPGLCGAGPGDPHLPSDRPGRRAGAQRQHPRGRRPPRHDGPGR